MSLQSVARQYANALFVVAQKSQQLEPVGRDLSMLVDLVKSHPELKAVFETPVVPARKKRALIDALIAAGPAITGEVHRLLQMLADRDRLMIIAELAEAFLARVMEADRVVPADVVTAFPLDEAGETAVATALSQATGRRVTVTSRVDPAIIGGVVARVGSVVYDGSVVRQLQRMRQRLSADA